MCVCLRFGRKTGRYNEVFSSLLEEEGPALLYYSYHYAVTGCSAVTLEIFAQRSTVGFRERPSLCFNSSLPPLKLKIRKEL